MNCLETIGEPGNLAEVIAFVRQATLNAAFDEDDSLTVDLIVEEVFLNVAVHGYKGRCAGPVSIHCASPSAGVLTLRFLDSADPFDPLASSRAPALDLPLSERRVGGLGLVLLKNMAESVSYRRLGDRNELSVRILSRRSSPKHKLLG